MPVFHILCFEGTSYKKLQDKLAILLFVVVLHQLHLTLSEKKILCTLLKT